MFLALIWLLKVSLKTFSMSYFQLSEYYCWSCFKLCLFLANDQIVYEISCPTFIPRLALDHKWPLYLLTTHLTYARIVYYFPNEQLHFNCVFWEYQSADEIQCAQPSLNECDHHAFVTEKQFSCISFVICGGSEDSKPAHPTAATFLFLSWVKITPAKLS